MLRIQKPSNELTFFANLCWKCGLVSNILCCWKSLLWSELLIVLFSGHWRDEESSTQYIITLISSRVFHARLSISHYFLIESLWQICRLVKLVFFHLLSLPDSTVIIIEFFFLLLSSNRCTLNLFVHRIYPWKSNQHCHESFRSFNAALSWKFSFI